MKKNLVNDISKKMQQDLILKSKVFEKKLSNVNLNDFSGRPDTFENERDQEVSMPPIILKAPETKETQIQRKK